MTRLLYSEGVSLSLESSFNLKADTPRRKWQLTLKILFGNPVTEGGAGGYSPGPKEWI